MSKPSRPRILITNDDGIHAEGILAVKAALDEVGEVFVIAPERPRSACGHSITLHKPLRMNRVRLPDGTYAHSSSGTPTDCVSLGILCVMDQRCDLVVSGINHGPNLGWDLTYSGTVSAAMEGVVMGIPAISISVVSYTDVAVYDFASKFTSFLARKVIEHGLPSDTLLNVNVPNLPEAEIKGIEITRQGKRRYAGKLEKRSDPSGRDYYWLGGDEAIDDMEEGTDVKAVAENRVSVTPVHMDLTGYSSLDEIRAWGIDTFQKE